MLYKAHHSAELVVPLYCVDPRHFAGTHHFGFPKTGSHRARFVLQSVRDLRGRLAERGSGLVVRAGPPETAVPELAAALSGYRLSVVLQQEATDEELRVERALTQRCRASSVSVITVWGATLHHRDDLPFPVKQ